MRNLLTASGKHMHWGLLVLRLGLGFMFIHHGWPKIMGGPEKWEGLGQAMGNVGISFAPTFWGFMGAFGEFGGGILLALGLFFRPANFLLFMTMVVAAAFHLAKGDGIMGASHAIEDGIVFLALLWIGPGNYSLDHRLFKR